MQNNKKVQKKRSRARKAKNVKQRPAKRGRYWNNPVGFASSAPIAVSNDLQQYVQFSRGKRNSDLLVSCCIPLYQICSNWYDTGLNEGGLSRDATTTFGSAALGSRFGIDGFNTQQDFLSPVLQLQSTSFVRYAIKKLQFCYEPQSSTTISDRLVFAYANDPNHRLVNPSTAFPTQAGLLAVSDSVAFAPWRSWCLDVTNSVNQNLLYTADIPGGNSDDRFSYFGCIGCRPSVNPVAASPIVVYGILYMKVEIEFREFCPDIEGFTSSLSSTLLKKGYRRVCSDPECKACTRDCLKKAASKLGESKNFALPDKSSK